MKLTSKATYGILAAVDLAMHNGTVPVQAKSIARRRAIPARFLEHVLNALKKAGLVDSQRGAQGGYLLRRQPSEVSLAEIVEALEGPITATSTRPAHRRAARHRLGVLEAVWEQLQQAELNVLNTVTLEDLARSQQRLEQEQALMYHI